MNIRPLKTSDVFAFCRVIKASGMREELSALVQKLSTQKNLDVESVGYDAILLIIESLSEKKAERTLYEALAPVLAVSVEEVADLEPTAFFAALRQIGEENNLADFFKYASGVLGKS